MPPTLCSIIDFQQLTEGTSALILPLYSFSFQDAIYLFLSPMDASLAIRWEIACRAGFCMRSAVFCFSCSGLAHCDIKGSNVMLMSG
jgi:hypothetical protein